MDHFLDGSGEDKAIPVNELMEEDSSARSNRDKYINDVLNAAENLAQNGETIVFCSTEPMLFEPSTFDWKHAIGECSINTKCIVEKNGGNYSATIYYYVYDVYDWEREETSMGNMPVSPQEMWELQYGGAAKGYYSVGSYPYIVTWTEGQRIGTGAIIEE